MRSKKERWQGKWKLRKETLLFNKKFKTNSTYPFLDKQRSNAHDRRRVARYLCPKKCVMGNRQDKQRIESDDFLVVWFLHLCSVALKEFTLVPAGPRSWYFFCTSVHTDVMMHNRAAKVSLTSVRGGFENFLMKPWMACQNPSWYKTAKRSCRQRTERGRILSLYAHALVMPWCGYRPRKCSLSGGETA